MRESTPPAGWPGAVRCGRLQRAPFALALIAALTSVPAFAASPQGLPEIELERLTLNPGGTGSLLLGTGELLQRGGYRLSFTGHYEKDPLVYFVGDGRVGSVVGHRVTGHLAAAYGLTERWELGVQVPLLLMQRGDDLTASGVGQPREGFSLGTPYLSVRFGILSQQRNNPVDLSVGTFVGLPIGSSMALARDSSVRALPSVMVGRRFGYLRAALDAGVSLRPSTTFSADANVRDEVDDELRLGGVLATTGDKLRGELDVIGSIPFARSGAAVETLIGARLPLNPSLELYALVGAGFGEAPGTPAFRGLLGIAFGNPAKDVGGDKVPVPPDTSPKTTVPPDNKAEPVAPKAAVGEPVAIAPKAAVAEPVTPAPKAALGEGRIEVKDAVYFGTNEATLQASDTTIEQRSFEMLDQVARLLLDHPELKKIWIEGHTDNVGQPEANRKLSQQRAEAVRDYLIQKGVAPERLNAKGYGESRPIASNSTEEGRAANRRVEFLTAPRAGTHQ